MNSNTRGDSLVGIIIGIFILSFILVGMVNVIGYSKDISYNYENKIEENLIQKNSKDIINKLDTSVLEKQEEFYVKKDTTLKEFEIFTGSTNENLQYIDKYGNNTSSGSEGKVFERKYINKIDILRHITYPTEIKNLVFHFDANYVNGTGGTNPGNGDTVNTWKDLSGNGFNATNSSGTPTFYESELNENPVIEFDGINDLSLVSDVKINNDIFIEKSFSVIFKSGFDVTSNQEIYNQGTGANGYEIYIDNKKLYIWVKGKLSDLGEVLPDTAYFITLVQNNDNVKNYINGTFNSEQSIVTINSHSNAEIGNNFKGKIGELISWNHALTKEEVDGVSNYFKDKWLKGDENIRHDIVETDISLIK